MLLSSNFGAKFSLESFDQRPVQLIHFFVAQRSIVGAIFEAQRHGALAFGNAFAFVRPDELGTDKVLDLLIVNCAQEFTNTDFPIKKQRNVTQNRRKPGQRRIEHWEFFSLQERREIYFSY